MRQRTYSVLSDIKTSHRFAPMVAPPSETHDGHPGVAWDCFHKVRIGMGVESDLAVEAGNHRAFLLRSQTHSGHPALPGTVSSR